MRQPVPETSAETAQDPQEPSEPLLASLVDDLLERVDTALDDHKAAVAKPPQNPAVSSGTSGRVAAMAGDCVAPPGWEVKDRKRPRSAEVGGQRSVKKPQLSFLVPVDNRNEPFQPK